MPADVAKMPATSDTHNFTLTVTPREERDPAPVIGMPELQRRVTINVLDGTLLQVLGEIDRQAGLGLSYSSRVVPVDRRVTVRLQNVSAQRALETALLGTNIRVGKGGTGQVVLMRAVAELATVADSVSGQVEGIVIDASTQTPVANVTTVLVGTNFRQITKPDGSFRIIDVPPGTYVIRATRLGFQPAETRVIVRVNTTTSARIELTPVPLKLNDVITTSSGSQKRLEIGNSIATINADSVVENSPVRNLSDLIAARAPGVEVLTTSGTVGAGSRVRIRGLGRISGSNDPIVIVDGVRIESDFSGGYTKQYNQAGGEFDFSTSASSRFDDIDPSSIAKIDILKGPSAATLYGSDAANGVIVITTKHGRSGPARWNFFTERGRMDMKAKFSESYRGWGTSSVTGPDSPCTLSDVSAGRCTGIDSVTHFTPLNDAKTTPFGVGELSSTGVQVSGGSDRLLYFFGGSVENAIGVLKMPDADVALLEASRNGAALPDWQIRPNRFDKQSGNSRITANFGDKGDLSLSTSFTHQMQANMNDAQVVYLALEGSGSQTINDGWADRPGSRPADLFAARGTSAITRGFASLGGNLRPFPWLNGRGTIGVDYSDRTDEIYLRTGDDLWAQPGFAGTQARNEGNTTIYSADVGGTVTLPVSSFLSSRTTVGAQYYHQYSKDLHASGTGIAIGATTFNGARLSSMTEAFDEIATFGWYVEETGIIRERLYLTAAIREDRGSAFGKNAKVPIYPKLSMSWLLSQEPFFPKWSSLSNLRLRAAYGHAGVQPSTTGAIRTYKPGTGYVDGQLVPTAMLNSLGNAELLPERSTEFEGGGDISLLDDRVTIEGTYYRKLSKDAIVGHSLPPSFGYPYTLNREENAGSVLNTGTEWAVTAQPVSSHALTWEFTVNTSANRNRLVSLAPGIGLPQNYPLSGGQEQYTVGYPLSGQWGRPILGYRDANGDGIISPDEVTVGDSAVFLGQPVPDRQASFTNTFGFFGNRLKFMTMFDYQGGLGQKDLATWESCLYKRCRAAVDPTASLGAQAGVAVLQKNYPYGTYYYFNQTVSWTRLRNLTVSYELPARFAEVVHATSARVSLMGQNLGLWSQYSGADPEVNTRAYRNKIEDQGGLPISRNWSLRFNLGL
jgi:TonB-linked SusC/RagA family outer membrane protein